MSKTLRFAWRTTAFGAVMTVLLVAVIQLIQRPVPGPTERFTALFTDASGLYAGADVRMYGLAVGKVRTVELDGTLARVDFTVRQDQPIDRDARVAIRYQSLAGQRYLDVRQPEQTTDPLPGGTTIDTAHTIPSFDITALFNGLQPVLAEISPDAVNQFAESMLAVLDGDGAGPGPVLDAIERIGAYVGDRQMVISTLVRNLRQMSDTLAGRSPHMITAITELTAVFATLEQHLHGIVDYAESMPALLRPLDDLAARLGLSPGTNADLDRLLRAALPDPEAAREVLSRLPGLLQTLDTLAAAAVVPTAAACGNGPAPVPAPLAILIAGQRITVCQR
ncbi:virulence factor Mce family protein [Nocardia otitidiscaviarum]|uniref:Virulence factor Mce family protein n=1 Tax=Nocardia otitidiscaviarum TaxID=1823 RepID=A0A379JGD4_9NOCA|nr:MCE family protein [Nocardia otitidiscaviarum]SUD47699.1 virulence factor Mce family protein [Nocardia otitidiscaviarum]